MGLVQLSTGALYNFPEPAEARSFLVGRHPDCEVAITWPHMGRRQWRCAHVGRRLLLAHLPATSNMTHVNGVAFDDFCRAQPSEVIEDDAAPYLKLRLGMLLSVAHERLVTVGRDYDGHELLLAGSTFAEMALVACTTTGSLGEAARLLGSTRHRLQTLLSKDERGQKILAFMQRAQEGDDDLGKLAETYRANQRSRRKRRERRERSLLERTHGVPITGK